ncbi:MAG: phospholipid/cholesterol/gamma-HCH transport system substrate-binding protein [Solirubrobacteraceae bacterium]|jgi:phospholipid/cholesterol/gamma-HCH transport system substrate-binding protein|nr:phospholipid/cholesterol/gamma-HCH transport system substrate-binding protein [Solirubrobacteraceae bacterium]MEA2333721.1 phospholipid/cholesterol/gamma-HCH transport system substrate-binding protein [Solirubrobacteraceae bacterium]
MRPARPSRGRFVRPVAVGALALVVLIVAFIVLSGGGSSTYKLEFAEGFQLVRGNQVQVGGVPVGTVKEIELTHDFKALVTITVESSLAPLHAGTVAQVRVPSLSSVANRYIALSPGPNSAPALADGARLPASATRNVTDLDQLFNTLDPKTRKGLQQFVQGTAESYEGQGKALQGATEYFAPSLAAPDHFFAELVRDQSTFTKFLVETAKAVTTIGARKDDLSNLVENANTTFTAIGSEQTNLAKGLKELPVTLRQGNRTFADLPSTFTALKKLVDASKPTVQPLNKLFTKLQPLLTTATPVVKSFALSFNRPGPNNDLTDYVRALPQLAQALTTATPVNVQSLKESVPITAFFGPYSPDLQGTLREFGQTDAYYDANGHYARVGAVFPDFTLGSNNNLTPASSPSQALAPLKSGQLRRCPGAATQPAADGSSPFTGSGLLSCDPSQTP